MKKLAVPLMATSILAGCQFSLSNDNNINNVSLATSGTESAGQAIERYEQTDGVGGGFAEDIAYDSATDTFTVDNLPFDGSNSYSRGTAVASLGPFKVFDGRTTVTDAYGGKTIDQFLHRGIYGVSTSGHTEFGIVRTGEYNDYGFGGFVYKRNNGVTLPTSGQAGYDGKYAGLRVFDNAGGIELTEGDVDLGIDFRDFNTGYAIQGKIYNRVAYDTNGTAITTANDVLSGQAHLPNILFVIEPGVISDNGVMQGQLQSYALDGAGASKPFETGKYYGIVSGDDAEEIVGVIVVESKDPRFGNPFGSNDVSVQETGGFIAYRD